VTLSSYEFTVQCGAPPDAVFTVLADATRWKDWAGVAVAVSEWDREGEPAPGGVGAVRKLGRWPVFTREQITEYAPPRHLGYTILSGVPVRGYHADVDLVPDGHGGTTIRWSGAFEPSIPGTGLVLEKLFRSTVLRIARGAAAEAERAAKR
jgi:Polyketide cyclase / dehydrase and lipid transport